MSVALRSLLTPRSTPRFVRLRRRDAPRIHRHRSRPLDRFRSVSGVDAELAPDSTQRTRPRGRMTAQSTAILIAPRELLGCFLRAAMTLILSQNENLHRTRHRTGLALVDGDKWIDACAASPSGVATPAWSLSSSPPRRRHASSPTSLGHRNRVDSKRFRGPPTTATCVTGDHVSSSKTRA